jgi:transcription-repair coupling factor (superfamily II helicase)
LAVLDRPVLHAFVRELVEHEKLTAFADALPQRARVSEAALPIVLASLHERLERPLVCLVPDDVDARDTADAVAWFLGDDIVGTLPSRGVSWESGLEPPPHLVGERTRALSVLARGGIVIASARGLAELAPPAESRPQPLELRAGAETGVDGLSEELALAGYSRVERVDDRGQFAVRGGLIDVFPTTGREPLRIEFFGDEVESIRAFSPFTQRALHPVDACTIFPATERRLDLVAEWQGQEGELRPVPDDLVPVLDRAPDFVFQPDDVERVWEEDGTPEPDIEGASELDPFPQSQPYAFEAQRPAIASRGLAEAETELAQLVRAGQRVVVAFPHRGEAARTQHMLRRVTARILEPGEQLPKEAELFFTVSPARRGFVWRDLGLVLLPDHQVFRRRVPRERRIGGRALQSFADLRTGDYVVHEDHGVAKLLGFETKEVAGVTRDYLLLGFRGDDKVYVPHEQLGKVSRYIGADAKAPALSKLGGKAWELLKSRARESV